MAGLRSHGGSKGEPCVLMPEDASTALEGYVPSSLKGVALQSSSTTWDDIGGLEEVVASLVTP